MVRTVAQRFVCRSLDRTGADLMGRTEAASARTRLTRILRQFHVLRRAGCDRSGCTRKQRNEWKN